MEKYHISTKLDVRIQIESIDLKCTIPPKIKKKWYVVVRYSCRGNT